MWAHEDERRTWDRADDEFEHDADEDFSGGRRNGYRASAHGPDDSEPDPDTLLRMSIRARLFDPESATSRLLETPPPPRLWVVEDLLPKGEGAMLIGEGGAGKGFLQMLLALCVAIGLNFGPFRIPKPGRVLLVSREDDRAELHRRLQAAVGLFEPGIINSGSVWRTRIEENLHLADVRGLRGVDLEAPAFHDILAEKVEAVGGVDLLALDPLGRLLPAGCKLNDQDGAGRIHVAVDELVKRTGATVMAVHHVSKAGRSTKPGEDRGAGASSGSHLLEDLARAVIRLVPIPGAEAKKRYDLDPHRGYVELTAPKANYAPTLAKPCLFVREAGGALRYVDQLSDVHVVRDQRVLEALAEHPDGLTGDEWEAVCKDLIPRVSRAHAQESRLRLLADDRVTVTVERAEGQRGPGRKIYRLNEEGNSDRGN